MGVAENESVVVDKNYDSHAFSKPQWKQSSCPHKGNVLIFFLVHVLQSSNSQKILLHLIF